MASAATEPARVNERKAAATDYAARGWCVFPAPPGQKKGYIAGKKANGRLWGNTTDLAEIARHWARWPHANIGIACGPESGLFVVEADTMKGHGVDGIANFAALVAEHGELPETIEQISPSGSHHYLFQYPTGVTINNSESKVAKGVDVRGDGGMIIAAPSIKPEHPEPYRWVKPPGLYDLAPCPDWLLKLCIAEGKPKNSGGSAMPPAVPSDSDDLVLSWLYTRPNDLSREDWVRLCFALKGHFGERAKDGWLSFSARYSGSIMDGEARRQWETAEPSGRVDLGTAIFLLGGHERAAPGYSRTREAPAPDNDAFDPETGEMFNDDNGDPGWTDADRPGANRPMIVIRAGEMHSMATAAEGALIEMGAPLYVRGENIVRPVLDQMPASKGRRTKVARLATIGKDAMLDHLSRSADWSKFNARKKTLVPADPPKDIASILLSREGEWAFPRIAGVITTPTLRADGSILSTPGYDQATQLLLLDPPPLPPLVDKPTKAHAEAALKVLDKLLDEFPFVDQASRSAALSGLITPVVRGAMDVASLHATTAPVAGSGKSYINDIAAAISTGDRAPVFSAAVKEDELEKRIFSALHAGQPIICLDNVNGALGGDFLCQAIERPVVQSRVLGVSKVPKIESRACFFATGNNIRLVGDMTRRVILCSLDPQMERPELREFEANPFDRVLADRGKYVAAALTICRAYIVAGCPGVLPALASFEDWSRIVRSALVWLGRDDPIKTMEAARDDDPTTSNLRTVLAAWYSAVQSSELTTARIIKRAKEGDGELYQALNDVAEGRHGEINARKLGWWLLDNRGRIVGDFKIVDGYDAGAKQKLWSVHRATPSN